MRILYLQDNGVVAIIHTSTSINPATGNPYTVEEVAVKDVPKGKKYKIVDLNSIRKSDETKKKEVFSFALAAIEKYKKDFEIDLCTQNV